jgi:hypothetical protein
VPNEYRHSVNSKFFVFGPKWVKNRVKKNIVSNLPWITDFNFRCGTMEASMKTEDRRLRTPTGAVRGGVEDGGNGEKAPPPCAALCRVLLAWGRRGKAPSPRQRPRQLLSGSMTIWSILNRGLCSVRLEGYSHFVPPFATWYRGFHNKNIFWGVGRSNAECGPRQKLYGVHADHRHRPRHRPRHRTSGCMSGYRAEFGGQKCA